MPADLFAPVCSITTTKRRRWFWALWLGGPPREVPFERPDASDGGAASYDEALAAAAARAGTTPVVLDPMWARAWIRVLRGEAPWPSKASRTPGAARPRPLAEPGSIWALLGVTREATEAELKAAYRRKVLEVHPDHGGTEAAFRQVLKAYEEAQRRVRRPRHKSP